MKYSNTKLRTISFEGNTIDDKAIRAFNEMNWMEVYELRQKIKDFKSLPLIQRACINYIAEFLL